MASYTILLPSGARPGHIEALEAAIPVKNGFRFWPLLFPMLFALMHRLWRPFAAMLCLMVLLGVAAAHDLIADWAVLLLDLLVGLYAANAAADWIVTARERQGFIAMAAMPGADEDEALARFAHHWMEGQVAPPIPATSSPAMRAPQGPVIGLFPESGGR
jgi:hypothetical protein